MKGKIIATILALVMISTAFALTVDAQASHVWITSSDGGGSGNIANAADTTSPHEGLARHYIRTRPGEVVLGATTPNPASSHDRAGPLGTSGTANMAQIDSEGFLTPTVNGDPTIFICERDTTAPLRSVSPIMVQVSSMAGGNVPNGYVASAPVYSYVWAEPMGFGQFGASTMTKIPTPVAPVGGPITWAAIAGVPNIYGYGVLESTANTGPWTEVGQTTGTSLTYTAVSLNWYSLVIYWAGTGAGFLNTQAVRGAVFGSPVQVAGGNVAPVAGSVATAPNPHNGNIASEQVTITATITDADAANTLSAEYTVNGGTTWTAFAQTGVSPLAVSAVYAFPNGYTIGAHAIAVRGYDGTVNSANAAGSIVVTDTTAPIITPNSAPGTTIYAGQNSFISIGYADFTPYQTAIANSYLRYQVNNGSWTSIAWTNASFVWGSYGNTLTASIPGAGFAVGDWIDYEGRVTDTAAVPNLGNYAGGGFKVLAAPPGVQDDCVVYGRVYLYAGAAGAYTPILSTGGQLVTATWWNGLATMTRTDTVNALGQFSIDVLNYTVGANIMLTTTFEAPYNNAGTNYTLAAIGPVQQNVLCGVPYSVTITAPIALSNQQSGVAFPTTYVIRDRAGLLAQGYYSFADGPMRWTSSDVAFVAPAPYTFNGIADGGTHNVPTLTLFSGGLQWINVSETTCDWYPTPWNNFQVMTGFNAGGTPVYAAGWLDDFDQITVNVLSGGFDWHVVVGWNIVSVPQDPVNKGTNAAFDSFDALNYCHWQLAGVTDLSLADRIGPSTYNVFDYGQAEGASFPMDGVHGYWVYSNVAGVCHFNSTNYSAGLNNVNAAAGWNLLGFTHNFVPWTVVPTASMFTTGVIDVDLNIAGPLTTIVATEWLEDAAPQWYHSYVVTDTFPGMATHNWAWDFTYSTQPGNGFFLWVNAATAITFPVAY